MTIVALVFMVGCNSSEEKKDLSQKRKAITLKLRIITKVMTYRDKPRKIWLVTSI